jgi:hypothetical protein
MKLSEAIRLGAMVTEQGFIDIDIAACALRAALYSIGAHETGNNAYARITREWPWTMGRDLVCPDQGADCRLGFVLSRSHRDTIWHLNDAHRWPRERIADWVATIEPAEKTEVLTSTVTDGTVLSQTTKEAHA